MVEFKLRLTIEGSSVQISKALSSILEKGIEKTKEELGVEIHVEAVVV